MKIKAYMDYNTETHYFQEIIYFKKPKTQHTNPDVILAEVEISILKLGEPK